eukprot:TRINITY_DN6873_c0_g1_i1.p1 TRINITY_DN6873_c0_g1~~TRINITY_DN6873_c0_g1_i1.p1  ORF type:complete len:1581 (-),score=202.94 TRINITY_DN6873_c0_g1_i1:60-4802(-)
MSNLARFVIRETGSRGTGNEDGKEDAQKSRLLQRQRILTYKRDQKKTAPPPTSEKIEARNFAILLLQQLGHELEAFRNDFERSCARNRTISLESFIQLMMERLGWMVATQDTPALSQTITTQKTEAGDEEGEAIVQPVLSTAAVQVAREKALERSRAADEAWQIMHRSIKEGAPNSKRRLSLLEEEFVQLGTNYPTIEQASYFSTREALQLSLSHLFHSIDHQRQGVLTWELFVGYCIDATLRGRTGSKERIIYDYRLFLWQHEASFEGVKRARYVPELDRLLITTRECRLTKPHHFQPTLVIPVAQDRGLLLCCEYISPFKMVVASSSDYTMSFHDLYTGKMVSSTQAGSSQTALRWHERHRRFYSGARTGQVSCWELSVTEAYVPKLLWQEGCHSGPVTDLLELPGDGSLVCCALDSTITLIEPLNGYLLARFEGHTGGILCLAFSQEHNFLISAGFETEALLWLVNSPDYKPFRLSDPSRPHGAAIIGVHAVRESPQVITCDSGGMVKIWDIRTLMPVQTLECSNEPPNVEHLNTEWKAFAFLEPYHRIVVAARRKVWVYEYNQAERQHPCCAATTPVLAALYNDHLKVFITASGKMVRTWDLYTGALADEYPDIMHEEITAMCLDPEGRRLFLGGCKGTVSSHNVSNGCVVQRWKSLNSEVACLRYCQERGYLVATSGASGIAILYDTPVPPSVSAISFPIQQCQIIGATEAKDTRCVDFHPALQLFIVGDGRNHITVWSTQKDREKHFGLLAKMDNSTYEIDVSRGGLMARHAAHPASFYVSDAQQSFATTRAGSTDSLAPRNAFLTSVMQSEPQSPSASTVMVPILRQGIQPAAVSPLAEDSAEVDGIRERAARPEAVCIRVLNGFPCFVISDTNGVLQLWSLVHYPYRFALLARWEGMRSEERNWCPMITCMDFSQKWESLYCGDEMGRVLVFHLAPFLHSAGMTFSDTLQDVPSSVPPPTPARQKIPLIKYWVAHSDCVKSLEVVANPQLVLTASYNKQVVLWTHQGSRLGILDQHGKVNYDLTRLKDDSVHLGRLLAMQKPRKSGLKGAATAVFAVSVGEDRMAHRASSVSFYATSPSSELHPILGRRRSSVAFLDEDAETEGSDGEGEVELTPLAFKFRNKFALLHHTDSSGSIVKPGSTPVRPLAWRRESQLTVDSSASPLGDHRKGESRTWTGLDVPTVSSFTKECLHQSLSSAHVRSLCLPRVTKSQTATYNVGSAIASVIACIVAAAAAGCPSASALLADHKNNPKRPTETEEIRDPVQRTCAQIELLSCEKAELEGTICDPAAVKIELPRSPEPLPDEDQGTAGDALDPRPHTVPRAVSPPATPLPDIRLREHQTPKKAKRQAPSTYILAGAQELNSLDVKHFIVPTLPPTRQPTPATPETITFSLETDVPTSFQLHGTSCELVPRPVTVDPTTPVRQPAPLLWGTSLTVPPSPAPSGFVGFAKPKGIILRTISPHVEPFFEEDLPVNSRAKTYQSKRRDPITVPLHRSPIVSAAPRITQVIARSESRGASQSRSRTLPPPKRSMPLYEDDDDEDLQVTVTRPARGLRQPLKGGRGPALYLPVIV